MADRLRYAAIRVLDWLDDATGHPAWPRLCNWICLHPWWDAGDRIEARRKGKRRP